MTTTLLAMFLVLVLLLAAWPLRAGFGPPVGTGEARVFRGFWAVWIAVWGVAALALGSGAVPVDPQPLRMALLFGGQVTLGVGLFATLPAVRAAIRAIPLHSLIVFQRSRVIGAAFLVGAALGAVSWPFALIAGIGDVTVGVAAWRATRPGRQVSRVDAARVTAHGLGDFALAIGTALVTGATIGWPFNMTPLFLVPIATLAHLVVVDRLRHAAAADATPVPSA
jgi:hypothetical protein